MITAQKTTALADTLSAHVLAHTFGKNAYGEVRLGVQTGLKTWLKEVAALAGLTWCEAPNDRVLLLGDGFTLHDALPETNQEKFLAFNLSPRFENGPVAAPYSHGVAKPGCVRLTPGMSPAKAAAALRAAFPGFVAYQASVIDWNRTIGQANQRQDARVETLHQVAPHVVDPNTPGKNELQRNFALRLNTPGKGVSDFTYGYGKGYVSGGEAGKVYLELNALDPALAEKLLAVMEAHCAQ